MKLDLKEIINLPGKEIPFKYELDISDYEYNSVHPFMLPVKVSGAVKNVAGVLELRAVAEADMTLICDRCAKEFKCTKAHEVFAVLAEEIAGEDDESIVLLVEGCVDLDDIVFTELVLDIDMKILCSEDCKGLCVKCGANLNYGECGCEKEIIDPRFAVLQQYMDKLEK